MANKLDQLIKDNENDVNVNINETGIADTKALSEIADNSTEVAGVKETVGISSSEDKKEVDNNNKNTTNLSALNLEATDFLFTNSKELNAKGKVKEVPKMIYPIKKKVLTWEMEATAGANKLRGSYTKPTNLAGIGTASNESGSYGSSYGLKVGVLWKKHWILKTGFEYHQLWSQFNYDESTTVMVPKDSILSQVIFDPLADSTVNRIYELNTSINATATRKVVHHNKYKLYSIPIAFGWQNTKERLLYGVSAGASLNFVRGQEGRRLDAESNQAIWLLLRILGLVCG